MNFDLADLRAFIAVANQVSFVTESQMLHRSQQVLITLIALAQKPGRKRKNALRRS
jgi:DNA-binding transcriptional LysR family regulator